MDRSIAFVASPNDLASLRVADVVDVEVVKIDRHSKARTPGSDGDHDAGHRFHLFLCGHAERHRRVGPPLGPHHHWLPRDPCAVHARFKRTGALVFEGHRGPIRLRAFHGPTTGARGARQDPYRDNEPQDGVELRLHRVLRER